MDELNRGPKGIPLKAAVDEALLLCKTKIKKVIVVKDTGKDIAWNKDTDVWLHELLEGASDQCPCEEMSAEDYLFILYTSGSTGKPKGVLHTTGGYLTYASFTHHYVFGYKPG